jgi:hypothetical protein
MNSLTYEIINRISSNFGLIDSFENKKSLINQDFCIKETLSFEDTDAPSKIYVCQQSINTSQVTVLVADCSSSTEEYFILIKVKDSIAYGLHFKNHEMNDALIACFHNEKWITCSMHLQATFLAAMEQINDWGFIWKAPKEYTEEFNLLVSFVNFYSELYDNEGN